ncbi:MAG: CNNM domain-containing protein [Bacteroides sp.]|nr:CNNM domain-containing protein [Bacteroides sp.]MCM1085999.1 CNNM domain-containing protein [Bacteroides sp.]MCM1168603.1 CNNM domain-containing protein [Bacteroides sp.]
MFLLILYLLLALCVSFVCSVLEAVLLSTPLSYIEVIKGRVRMAAAKDGITRPLHRKLHSALIFVNIKENIDRSLSSILSLNTVAHTIGAAGVGAQSAKIFGNAYVGITSVILTFVILVFSEIFPKSLGTRYWRGLCLPSGRIIRVLVWICYPLVILSEGISWLVTRGKKDPGVSREEVSALVNIGSKEGIFTQEEIHGLRSMLDLRNLRVRDIMTPRMVAVTACEEMTLGEFYREKNYLKFSRIPVYEEENPDKITGFVLLKHVFEQLAADRFDLKLKSIKRPIFVAVESQKLLSLWNRMQQIPNEEDGEQRSGRKKREQIAMVVDEYGSFVGIVTVEDMVETMLGMEIVDEKDTITDMQQYARQKWVSSRAYHRIDQEDDGK